MCLQLGGGGQSGVEGTSPSEVSNTDSDLPILVMLVGKSSTQYNSQQNEMSHNVTMKHSEY
jgi:hypothetical protein